MEKLEELQEKAKRELHTFITAMIEEKTENIQKARHRIEAALPGKEVQRFRDKPAESRREEETAIKRFREKLTASDTKRPSLLRSDC
nr:hypothetical protein BaRGS_006199 [Batillaria attramentaria]